MSRERLSPRGDRDPPAPEPAPALATPREAAKALVRPYVARGDPIGWYQGHALGYRCPAYAAAIGPAATPDSERQGGAPDHIAVTALDGQPCHAVFPLVEIWEEVETELRPGPLQRRLC